MKEPYSKVRIVGVGECERCSFVTVPAREKRHPDHKDTALLCIDCKTEETCGPTHHHACDCREAKFKRLLEAAKEAFPCIPDDCADELEKKYELLEAIKELQP